MKKKLLTVAMAFIIRFGIVTTSAAILNWRLKLAEILEKQPAIIFASQRL